MIGITPHYEKQMMIITYEDSDIHFLTNIIGLIGDRNTLLKEIEHAKKEGLDDGGEV